MKRFPALLFSFALGMSFFAIISWNINEKADSSTANQGKIPPDNQNNVVISVRKFKIRSGASAAQFEKFAIEKFALDNGKLPGYKDYILKADRGDDLGNYIAVSVFDSKQTRDFYYPVAGKGLSPEGLKLAASLPNYSAEFIKMVQGTPTDSSYTDYIMLYR